MKLYPSQRPVRQPDSRYSFQHLTTERAPVAVLPPDPECGRPRPPHSGHNPLRCGRGQLTLNAEKMMLGTAGSPSGFFTIKPRPGADPE